MEQYTLERGTVALPFYVTLNGQTVATFNNGDDAMDFLRLKNGKHLMSVDGACSLSNIESRANQKAEAFKKLLMCADWANGRKTPVNDGTFDLYIPVWDGSEFFKWLIKFDCFPFYLTNEAYHKFMAIEGIELLLHEFLNTGK